MSKERERLAREWAEFALAVPVGSPASRAAAEHILATTKEPTMADVKWDSSRHFGLVCEGEDGVEWVMLYRRDDGRIMGVTPDLQKVRGLRPQWLTPNGKKYELREITEPEHPVEPSTKTMDEYSPEEQAGMTGMWAEYRRGGEPRDFMIIEGGVNRAGRVPCYNPDAPTPHAWAPDPDELIPRFDLPRVWDKDGQPCEATVSSNENVGANQPEHPEVLSTVEDYENAPEGTVVAQDDRLPRTKSNMNIWTDGALTFVDIDMCSTGPHQVLRKGWGE